MESIIIEQPPQQHANAGGVPTGSCLTTTIDDHGLLQMCSHTLMSVINTTPGGSYDGFHVPFVKFLQREYHDLEGIVTSRVQLELAEKQAQADAALQQVLDLKQDNQTLADKLSQLQVRTNLSPSSAVC